MGSAASVTFELRFGKSESSVLERQPRMSWPLSLGPGRSAACVKGYISNMLH